ncbi:MAG: ketoacyl-ACP synthase III [Eubacterium sp.]|nr:ketoacyl-ACP synthase III [Eubacterium sp.]
MSGIRIVGTGSAVPARMVSNSDLEKYVDTSDEWIYSRTGIKNRYFCEDEKLYELCARASKTAMERAGVDPSDIGICISATLSADYATPSNACMLQRELGLPTDIPAFDVNAACSGFIYSLHIASRFVDKERPYALVTGGEMLSRILDMEDRSTCVLFGDGAGAAVIKYDESAAFYGTMGSRGDNEALVCGGINTEDPHVRMKGQAIFRFAVKTIDENLTDILDHTGNTIDSVDYVVCHQANRRIISHVAHKRKAPEGKFFMDMDKYANTSAASIPLALDDMVNRGLLSFGKGQKVVALGFGGGLTYAGALLEF